MYVRAHAAEYQVDPNRIVIVGASAGGHLCASEALLHEELKENVLENLAKFQKADMVEQYRKISARPDAVGFYIRSSALLQNITREVIFIIQMRNRDFVKNYRLSSISRRIIR